MRSYLVQCLVEFENDEHSYWSEGADETFSIANKVNAQVNGVHVLGYFEISPQHEIDKYAVLTEEGGI